MTLGAEEGRTERRNAAGSCKEAKIRRYPNGETRHRVRTVSSSIVMIEREKLGELKHLSSRRKRKQK